jgi:hypothetical protein
MKIAMQLASRVHHLRSTGFRAYSGVFANMPETGSLLHNRPADVRIGSHPFSESRVD